MSVAVAQATVSVLVRMTMRANHKDFKKSVRHAQAPGDMMVFYWASRCFLAPSAKPKRILYTR